MLDVSFVTRHIVDMLCIYIQMSICLFSPKKYSANARICKEVKFADFVRICALLSLGDRSPHITYISIQLATQSIGTGTYAHLARHTQKKIFLQSRKQLARTHVLVQTSDMHMFRSGVFALLHIDRQPGE